MTEVRIGVVGNVDAGKSTLISVLKNNNLDDGRGLMRKKILLHPHEKETGRTSSISKHYIYKSDKKNICLIDLAGHEKYLKTTLRGLSSNNTDYAILVIGANMGVSHMTREHLSILLALKIKFVVIITKIDICPEDILNKTISDINNIILKTKLYKGINQVTEINNPVNIDNKHINVFKLSNTTGENINMVKEYLFKLNSKYDWEQKINKDSIFSIDERFQVKGVGTIISGKLISGKVLKGDTLFMGPFNSNGDWFKIGIKSIHNDFREDVPELLSGMAGCFAIKMFNKKEETNIKSNFRKGLIACSNKQKSIKKFKAHIKILNNHSTTIKNNFQPIINCNNVVQTVSLILRKEDILRGGSKALINLNFKYRPEYICINDVFLLREGKTRGLGKIVEI